jgi:hypothetical protein
MALAESVLARIVREVVNFMLIVVRLRPRRDANCGPAEDVCQTGSTDMGNWMRNETKATLLVMMAGINDI